MNRCFVIILNALLLPTLALAGSQFEELAPLLKENCTKCHGGAKKKGGLDLRALPQLLKGGDSGPAFVPGEPARSRLFTSLSPDADPHMPPKGQLSQEQIKLVEHWILHFGAERKEPGATPATPEPSLPANLSPRLAIDVLVEKSWLEKKVQPAAPIDDASFVRRLSLDLLGRIPTVEERARFVSQTNSDKRSRLLDELLASKASARHLAEIFNAALLGREVEKKKSRGDREKHFLPYLRWAFETNRPWNKVGHDLIVARPETPEERGATWFLYEQGNDASKMATMTSAALLGKQVQCAQCHDHPVAPEIEQRHYWGLVAFFDRSRNVSTNEGPRVAERAAGGYNKFANLEGASSESELVFLNDQKIEEPGGRRDKDANEHYLITPPNDWVNPPKAAKGKKPTFTTKVGEAPQPKFSRRAELARLAIEGNPDFARAFVNRSWALFLGRGFVHPVDKMTSAYPPSHPELLEWLAQDFASHGYDVRRLFKAILSSRAYSLSMQHPAEVPPLPSTFARAVDKPLPAEVFLRSVLVALGAKAEYDGAVTHEESYRATFVKKDPALFAEFFSPSVQQAMFANNGKVIDEILRKAELPLITDLANLENGDELIDRLFLSAYGRSATSEERERIQTYLSERSDRKPEALRQILWALFMSAEFRLNH